MGIVQQPSRRALPGAVALAPIVAAIPAITVSATIFDPDEAFTRWKAVHAEINAWPEDDGDAHLWDQLAELESLIADNAHASIRALEVSLWVGLQPLTTYNWEHQAIMAEDVATLIQRDGGSEPAGRLVIDSIAAVRRLHRGDIRHA